MGDVIHDMLPRERRYSILPARAASVTIEGDSDGERRSVEAQLVDLSRSGAELTVTTCPAIDSAARLSISVPELHIDLVVEIEVCWAEPGEDDSWRIGCRFEPELPQDVLEVLSAGGFLDRRAETRTPVSLRATACWEHDEARIPVRLHDISVGGFCMSCAQIGQSDRRLLLHLSRPDGKMESIRARMQWRLKTGELYLVGCALENVLDFHRLRAVADAEAQQRQMEANKRLPRTPWIMFGCVASVTFAVSFALLSLATRPRQTPPERLLADARDAAPRTKPGERPAAEAIAKTTAGSQQAAVGTVPTTTVAVPAAPSADAVPAVPAAPVEGSRAGADAGSASPPMSDPTLAGKPPAGAGDVVVVQETEVDIEIVPSAAPPRSTISTPDSAAPGDAPQPSPPEPPPVAGNQPPADEEPSTRPPAPGIGPASSVDPEESPAPGDARSTDRPPVSAPYGLREAIRRLAEAREAASQHSDPPQPDAREIPREPPDGEPQASEAPTPRDLAPPLNPPPSDWLPDESANEQPLPAGQPPPPPTPVEPPPAAPDETATPETDPSPPQAADEAAAPKNADVEPASPKSRAEEPSPPSVLPTTPKDMPRQPNAEPETWSEVATRDENPRAISEFNRGHDLFRRRQFGPAAAAFQAAASEDPSNALYCYTLALAQYQLGQRDAALHSAQQGIEWERMRPIEQWGSRMQSYQGAGRVWLEKLRGGAR